MRSAKVKERKNTVYYYLLYEYIICIFITINIILISSRIREIKNAVNMLCVWYNEEERLLDFIDISIFHKNKKDKNRKQSHQTNRKLHAVWRSL